MKYRWSKRQGKYVPVKFVRRPPVLNYREEGQIAHMRAINIESRQNSNSAAVVTNLVGVENGTNE